MIEQALFKLYTYTKNRNTLRAFKKQQKVAYKHYKKSLKNKTDNFQLPTEVPIEPKEVPKIEPEPSCEIHLEPEPQIDAHVNSKPLSEIEPEPVVKPPEDILIIPLSQIELEKDFNPRKFYDDIYIKKLADSITETGLQTPITVRPCEDHYLVVAGHCRVKACRLAGVTEIPCVIKDLTDKQAFYASVAENTARKEMDPISEALAFQKMVKWNLSLKQISQKVGVGISTVRDRLALLTLSTEIQQLIIDSKLPIGHALVLANYKLKPENQLKALDKIVKAHESGKKLKVTEFEVYVKTLFGNEKQNGVLFDVSQIDKITDAELLSQGLMGIVKKVNTMAMKDSTGKDKQANILNGNIDKIIAKQAEKLQSTEGSEFTVKQVRNLADYLSKLADQSTVVSTATINGQDYVCESTIN